MRVKYIHGHWSCMEDLEEEVNNECEALKNKGYTILSISTIMNHSCGELVVSIVYKIGIRKEG